MSASDEVMNEEAPAHDMDSEAGDPSQDLRLFERLLLEYLQKMDGNEALYIKTHENLSKYRATYFYSYFSLKNFHSVILNFHSVFIQ